MQENLELELLKNVLIIIRAVRQAGGGGFTHFIFTRLARLDRAEVAELPGGGLEVVEGGGQPALLLVQLHCAVELGASQEPSGLSCNRKWSGTVEWNCLMILISVEVS